MIYVTGDTHREFSRFGRLDLTEDDLIIVLGDVCINYYLDSSDDSVKKKLNKYPCRFFFVRGNHEERPENISSYSLNHVEGIVTGEVFTEKKYPKLMFATEGLCEIGGNRCFVTNGAYSVDKYYRLEKGYSWFPDEELTDAEMAETLAKAEQAGKVDYVFSHTCPEKYMPRFMFLDGIDKSKVSHRMEIFYDQLEETLDYGRWWCGHFHTDWSIDKMRFMYYDILELKKVST
ncbi:MAG: metallophosphoesterase [Firmicutes bacterium]|nr:metallophosphoesterase [Bacillota bacterium]